MPPSKSKIIPKRANKPYKEGELEVMLSLPPTAANVRWLSTLLDRSEDAIKIVYRIAFDHGRFGQGAAIQRKVLEAKRRLGICIGRKTPRQQGS